MLRLLCVGWSSLITKTFDSPKGPLQFTFRKDGWLNMTAAARHFGKDLSNWLRSPETQEYIEILKSVEFTEYVQAERGRFGGTWAHPKLAVFFARWLDVRFAVWCDMAIDDILRGHAELLVTKPQESSLVALEAALRQANLDLQKQKEDMAALSARLLKIEQAPVLARKNSPKHFPSSV